MFPYGKHSISDTDIAAVVEVLRSDWLTTGPKVAEFEDTFAAEVGAEHAVAVCSGTAALHSAMFSLGIGPGDEVIVPPMTFAATANCVLYLGGTPVFADVDADTLLIDPRCVQQKITRRTKAIIVVDYTGQPCDYDSLMDIARRHGVALVADSCHSLGGSYKGRPVGSLADLNVFSFHPVKPLTTGEGGMITTQDAGFAERMRAFRNHGISTDHRERQESGTWFYEMTDLGYNYRITDFQCALGLSQLAKLPRWIARRQQIADAYDRAFRDLPQVEPLAVRANVSHAYHLYVVQLDADRRQVFNELHTRHIGANVHYIPVHLHPYYMRRCNTSRGMCPNAEAAYERIISLPMFPSMTDDELSTVIEAVRATVEALTTKCAGPNRRNSFVHLH